MQPSSGMRQVWDGQGKPEGRKTFNLTGEPPEDKQVSGKVSREDKAKPQGETKGGKGDSRWSLCRLGDSCDPGTAGWEVQGAQGAWDSSAADISRALADGGLIPGHPLTQPILRVSFYFRPHFQRTNTWVHQGRLQREYWKPTGPRTWILMPP